MLGLFFLSKPILFFLTIHRGVKKALIIFLNELND